MDKRMTLQGMVDSADGYTMSSRAKRRRFGAALARELGLWEPAVQSFMDEMLGLAFFKAEDRQTFIAFFAHAFALMG